MLMIPGKIVLSILLNRIKPMTENNVKEQASFRKGTSTTNQIISSRQIKKSGLGTIIKRDYSEH